MRGVEGLSTTITNEWSALVEAFDQGIPHGKKNYHLYADNLKFYN